MNIQDAYTRWSDTYDSDRNLTRDLDHRATQDALKGLRYQNIMELGCGTGKNTAFLTTIGGRILALDFSPGMLRHAKAKKLTFARSMKLSKSTRSRIIFPTSLSRRA